MQRGAGAVTCWAEAEPRPQSGAYAVLLALPGRQELKKRDQWDAPWLRWRRQAVALEQAHLEAAWCSHKRGHVLPRSTSENASVC